MSGSQRIRLGLSQLDGNKQGFLNLFFARQKAGACVPLRKGTIAGLEDSHDEQGVHLDCIKHDEDPVCFWALNARFGEAPY